MRRHGKLGIVADLAFLLGFVLGSGLLLGFGYAWRIPWEITGYIGELVERRGVLY